jgi:fructose-bisphosphate aldolase class I
MNSLNLGKIARTLVAPGKGLLAADESTGTISKRFLAAGLTSNPELNRKYRQMLFTTAGIEAFLSGVIMFDETVHQATDEGESLPSYLAERGIIPGIKVDEGKEPAPASPKEMLTKGLGGLPARLEEYKKLGLSFTKWRAVVLINDIYPSGEVLKGNSRRLAEFARLSQEKGFVPVVEPEVLMDGPHTTTRCEEVTGLTLKTVFSELVKAKVDLGAILLKTNMVLPGKDSGVKAEPIEVANATLRALLASVPKEVPGIVFLSGGQSAEEATANLNEINKLNGNMPWELSFSYGRALQNEALEVWRGQEGNNKVAQEAFYNRASLVSRAREGKL